MANAEAFSSGFDMGSGKKSQKKSSAPDEKSPTPEKRDFAPKASPSAFKKGGTVRRTGMAKVHKKEEVLAPKEAKEYREMKKNRKAVATSVQAKTSRKRTDKKKTSARKRIASKG